MTRAALIASLAVVSSLLAVPAAADDRQDIKETMTLVSTAIRIDEPEVLVSLMAGSVDFDLDAPGCGKAYKRKGKATGKARLALARCLVALGKGGTRQGGSSVGSGSFFHGGVTLGETYYDLVLQRLKGRIRITLVEHTKDSEGDTEGVEGGEEGGVVGGVVGGVAYGPPPAPPPPPPPPPQNLAPQAFDAQRISGEKYILPDDDTKEAIARSGKTQFLVPVKVCVRTDGTVSDVRILKSSGYPAYDQKLNREIRKWRYTPFLVNGAAAPACGLVNFSYRQT